MARRVATTITANRSKALRGLPADAQDFFQNASRHAIRDVEYGSLNYTLSEKDARFRQAALKEVKYYYLDSTLDITDEYAGKLAVLGTSILYDSSFDEVGGSSDFSRLIKGYLTTIAIFVSNQSMLTAGIVLAGKNAGYHIVGEEISVVILNEMFDATIGDWCDATGFENRPEAREYRNYLTVAVSTLLLLVKRLTTNSCPEWFRRRWIAFAALLATKFPENQITHPPLQNCLALNTILSSNHPFRNIIFRLMRGLAHQVASPYRPIFQAIMRNMWWTEMSHIGLIEEYIVSKHNDLFGFTDLIGGEKSNLTLAFEFLNQYPVEERPFIRLLLPADECNAVASRHFRYLVAAARVVAEMDNPGIKNLRMQGENAMKGFMENVKAYLEYKREVGPVNAAESLSYNLNPVAGRMLLNSITNMPVPSKEHEDEDMPVPDLRA